MDNYDCGMVKALKVDPMCHIPSVAVQVEGCQVWRPSVKSNGQSEVQDGMKTEKKKPIRFDGFPEEEIYNRRVPDHLAYNLDILMIGTNPGLFAAYKGHHYAGPGNHFWKCLHLSGLIPEQLSANDDYKLIEYGIGFTNIVDRATRTMADLKLDEIKDGAKTLLEKIRIYRPKIAVFNGKEIYRLFSGKKEFFFGKQPFFIEGTQTIVYVMPSSSARFSQLPRVSDKVPYFIALRKLRDHLRGILPDLTEREVVFSSALPTAPRKNAGGKMVAKVLPAAVKVEVMCDNGQQYMDLLSSGIIGLDEQGKPILPSRSDFDFNLIKLENLMDHRAIDECMESSFTARQTALEMANGGGRCSSTPTTDLSEFFIDPLPAILPHFPMRGVYTVNGISYFPTTSSQDGEGGGENGETGGGDGSDGQQQQEQEQPAEQVGAGGEGDANGAGVPPQAEESYLHQPSSVLHDDQGALTSASSTVDSGPYDHAFVKSEVNGADNLPVELLPVEQSPIEAIGEQKPIIQHATPTAPGPRPHHSVLPPEVVRHVEEAIECVVQRAREGPLEMPAFRTQAEKAAAAHAHHQQQHQQQQMLANLQMHAAAVAAAAHFDLGGGVKTEHGFSGGNGQGQGSSTAVSGQSIPNATPTPTAQSLYQYFQPQQPHQANQAAAFGAGNAGAGSASTYGQWPTATTNASQQSATATNLYNPAMAAAAQFYPNFTGPTAINQQLYSASQLAAFPNSPYFTAAQQQQQAAAAAMYGQYAASGGFVVQQQQSPHNL